MGYTAESYLALADLVLQDPNVDLLVAVSIDHKNRRFPAEELVQLSRRQGKPIVVYYISRAQNASAYRETCQSGGVPFYLSVQEAAWGTAGLIRRRRTLDRVGSVDGEASAHA